MKRLKLIFILIILTALLSSCNFTSIKITERIKPPNNDLPPISGQWKIDKYKKSNNKGLTDEKAEEMLNKKVLFHKKAVVIGKDLCLNPSYKIKKVNSEDYLLYQYRVEPKYLELKSKEVQIITLTSEKQFFYEFIKENDEKIIMNIDGIFFYLTKISDKIDDKDIDEYIKREKIKKNGSLDSKDDEILRSGILLGLKYLDEDNLENEMPKWKYRTVWISSENRELDKIYETEDLFMPRKTGFWKVGIDRVRIGNHSKDILYAYPVNKELFQVNNHEYLTNETKNLFKSIMYLGNDYISLETIENFPDGKVELKTYPIDNIKSGSSIKISDIIGESASRLKIEPKEESFALSRRNGHWIMKGSVNIKIIPPKELVMYDELFVPWNKVKIRVPEAEDVYTSPNKDIALILTNQNILIYTIEKGELSKEPIRKIKLNNSENVVMAEWATAKYIYMWEEEFLKNEVSTIEE